MFDFTNQGWQDQMDTALSELSRITRSYFLRQIEAGFTPLEALKLTAELQNSIVNGKRKGG